MSEPRESIEDLQILRKLEEIGGDVEARELAHHLSRDSVFGAYELVERGLVESRTYYTLTERGRGLITSPSPEGPAPPGPGDAGVDLPPTGFAACHGRSA